MRLRVSAILTCAVLGLVPAASWADLGPYSQDFEGLVQTDPAALANDGWLVFGNVFFPDGNYFFGYGPFAAPNGGPGFCGIDIGQGGPPQGAQQLVVYNDYNQGLHANGFPVEANVFQEQIIGAADVGNTWLFEYQAKRGNIVAPPTTALAFIKTLDPNNFSLSNFITVDMTDVPETWGSYSMSIFIDPGLVGHILQFGFLSTTTFYAPSGIFYDNVNFGLEPVIVSVDVKPGSCPNPVNVRSPGGVSVAILGDADIDVTTIDPASIRLAGVAPLRSDYEDVGTPFWPYTGREECDSDCNELEADGWMDLTLKFNTYELLAAMGDVQDGDCLVFGLTGNFWPAYGGGPIEGEDVVVVLDRGLGRPVPPVLGTAPTPGGLDDLDPQAPVQPTRDVRNARSPRSRSAD